MSAGHGEAHDAHGEDQHGGAHGGGHHNGNPVLEWIGANMGGIIEPMGKRFESVAEAAMMPAVNGVFLKLGRWYLVIATPVFLLMLMAKFTGH